MAKKTKKTEEITKKFGDERRKALDDALKNIEKDFGKGAVMRLGERVEQKVQVMSSGSLALDIALGAGGYRQHCDVRYRWSGPNGLVPGHCQRRVPRCRGRALPDHQGDDGQVVGNKSG